MKQRILFAAVLTSTMIIACKGSKQTQSGTATPAPYHTQYTYTTNIKAIIDPGCGTKCHRAEKKAGGIDLSNYESVKQATLHGKLVAAINHHPDAKMMPPNGVKMDTIFIEMIEDWAKGGAPE